MNRSDSMAVWLESPIIYEISTSDKKTLDDLVRIREKYNKKKEHNLQATLIFFVVSLGIIVAFYIPLQQMITDPFSFIINYILHNTLMQFLLCIWAASLLWAKIQFTSFKKKKKQYKSIRSEVAKRNNGSWSKYNSHTVDQILKDLEENYQIRIYYESNILEDADEED